jgi:hydroxymethylpyrimidine/phosphomethylpyrimidine kinase
MKPVALTIAGSDSCGGAGIQADLKTFHQFGVYGMSVVTLVTAQNTQRVSVVKPLAASLVRDQLRAVLEDIPPQAAKCGALGTAENIELVAEYARDFSFPLVVDPVMISKHGAPLIAEDARQVLADRVLRNAFLVTPNLHEAAVLAGTPVESVQSMEQAARRIADLGPKAVLVKGGYWSDEAVDVLWYQDRITRFTAPRLKSKNTHGTGCTYSAAVTAELAKGRELEEAIQTAKRFISRAIAAGPGLGRGWGPVDHHADSSRPEGQP